MNVRKFFSQKFSIFRIHEELKEAKMFVKSLRLFANEE